MVRLRCVPSKFPQWRAPTLDVMVFGDKAFKRVKLNKVIRVGPYSNRTDVLTRRESDTRGVRIQRKGHVRTQRVGGHLHFSPDIDPAGTLGLDFQRPEL